MRRYVYSFLCVAFANMHTQGFRVNDSKVWDENGREVVEDRSSDGEDCSEE